MSYTNTTTTIAPKGCCGPFGRGGRVTGHVAEGWGKVREAFEANFAERLELGAQLVIYHKGELVVDLAGHAPEQPGYGPETLQCVFSSGKNMEAVAIAMLVDRGLINYEDKVCKHWPEFGQRGKEVITIADVMRHGGGVPYMADPDHMDDFTKGARISKEDVKQVKPMEAKLEAAPCIPGHTYHAFTRGWLVGAILRRVDPAGRSLSQFLRQEVTEPLGLTYFVGIPEAEQKKYKYADMRLIPMCYNLPFEILPALCGCGDPVLSASIKTMQDPKNPILRPTVDWIKPPPSPAFNNTPEGRAMEISSAGMYGNARSIAKINAALAGDGSFDGVRLLSPEGVARALDNIETPVLNGMKTTFGWSQAGFGRFRDAYEHGYKSVLIGESDKAPLGDLMGWGGWGGSISMFDREKKFAIAYTLNGMSNYLVGGPRSRRILGAVREIIG